MNSNSKPERFKSFDELGGLLKSGKFRPAGGPKPNKAAQRPVLNGGRPDKPGPGVKPDNCDDQRLFLEAMAGVKPLENRNQQERTATAQNFGPEPEDPEAEIFQRLASLVDTGDGFVVALTPEYREGVGYGIHPLVAEKLHRGDFPIQDHIDLHGYSAAEAKAVLDSFLEQAVATHKCAVLVVHGRGLSSPGEPVLKAKVREWLTCGRWRKWVAAFTSARNIDGGAGATYVLLRRRAASAKVRFEENK